MATVPTDRSRAGEDVVKQAFGASLYEQGRGFYVTLELFALVWGTLQACGEILPAADDQPLLIHQRSHDFARRLASSVSPENVAAERRFLAGRDTESTLRSLMASLRVPVPGRRSEAKWPSTHLYPYTGALVHYDAVERKSEPHIERYLYRGAGGLAHKLLRTDPDDGRLQTVRDGLRDLLGSGNTALARLAEALAEHDRASAQSTFRDEREARACDQGGTVWPDRLRTGVSNIVSRRGTPRARRVEALMHWVPYCMARYQHDRALVILGVEPRAVALPVDCRAGANPIRHASREVVDHAKGAIFQALAESVDRSVAGQAALLDQRSQKWREHCRGFFAGTLGAVGALNAMTGKRYSCLRADLVETLVLVLLRPDEEMTFEAFCQERLYGQLRLVVDERSAQQEAKLTGINGAEFRENREELARLLKDLGLLREYSDATRMVSVGGT